MSENTVLLLGAVAYDPKVVTIWEGFKAHFARHGLHMDYLLYSNYERQVEALINGQIHVAWNSPLAWIRARRLATALGIEVQAVVMRDTDCDLTSVIVVREDSPLKTVMDLKGLRVAVGAVDSPQATLLPLAHLHAQGLQGSEIQVQYHNVLVGKHGDHIGGEHDAAQALVTGKADAACLLEYNYHRFLVEGTLPAGTTRMLSRTPAFDHCNFTVVSTAPSEPLARFQWLLIDMSYDDPDVRPLGDLEGLKAWYPGRVTGYQALEAAVTLAGFYDQQGNITATDYRY
ncbi:MAG: PhnD/SsuA/transferrin family substrate-binding protein [Ktedonobacteraceae bacterium]|nr:PhnD/SsuA/transferrin family substrate-binding protein [Ktedonobacteraceae bacterium]